MLHASPKLMLRRGPYDALYLLIALYMTISGAVVLAFEGAEREACSLRLDGGWAVCDQKLHLALINYFVGYPASVVQYPDPELVANVPGFHLLVARVHRTG